MIVEILTTWQFAHIRFITLRVTTKNIGLFVGNLMTPSSAHRFYNDVLDRNMIKKIDEAGGMFEGMPGNSFGKKEEVLFM